MPLYVMYKKNERSKLMVSPETWWLSVPPHWANVTHKTRGEQANPHERAGDPNAGLSLLRGRSPNCCASTLLYLSYKSFSLKPSHKFYVGPAWDWCSLPDIVWTSKAHLADLIDQDLINKTNCLQLQTSSSKHIRGKLAEKWTIW